MTSTKEAVASAVGGKAHLKRGYAPISGLQMYYEIEGTGEPLVFIHPALGFGGLEKFPGLTQRHSLVRLDLQGHGRTADLRDRPLSIEQYAEDVIALLDYLGISKADIFGESYGGNAAVLIAIRHPERVRRVAAYSATFGPAEIAHDPAMVRFDHPPTPYSRDTQFQRESYKSVAPDAQSWPTLWDKVTQIRWSGFSREELLAIRVPMLIMVGDRDFVRLEHAIETFHAVPSAELAVIPDAGHFALYSEPERVMPIVQHFLEKAATRSPVAHAGLGYHPGESR
ncbi:MAG TPA: alpha/beta hydrolase [Gemmatimonadaceae bacterium]|jgi:pimeloyl-ACP methyl ester carboxylesterase